MIQFHLIKLIKETGELDVLLSLNFDTWLSFAIEMDLSISLVHFPMCYLFLLLLQVPKTPNLTD